MTEEKTTRYEGEKRRREGLRGQHQGGGDHEREEVGRAGKVVGREKKGSGAWGKTVA